MTIAINTNRMSVCELLSADDVAGTSMSVERLIRHGIHTGPLELNWVVIGGGADGPNPRNLLEFINRCPGNAC